MLLPEQELRDIVAKEHWEKGFSIREIERKLGLKPSRLSFWLKRYSIPVRSRIESMSACAKTPERQARVPRGSRHWAYGQPKLWARKRMLLNNPMWHKDIVAKAVMKRVDWMRANPSRIESLFLPLFRKNNIPWVFQHAFPPYIIDFAFFETGIALEIDGRTHDRANRRALDKIRDEFLLSHGWIVIRQRVNLRHGQHLHRLLRVMEALIPGLQVASLLPPAREGQYRVLLRSQQYFTGVKIKDPHEIPADMLPHNRIDWPITPGMCENELADAQSADGAQAL